MSRPKVATYSVKWDPRYRKRWGIKSQLLPVKDRDSLIQMKDYSRQAYRLLNLCGYVRMDIKKSHQGGFYLLEANSNPSISKFDDFAKSAKGAGLEYDKLIQKILDSALESF